ncbi:MAG: dihydrolipoyl dehydrogenase [Candidatus Omnitrophica bacterium]|nr:dihydrolipoyl dehydrogenase [Candidatus Omnitrophota bacterium]
MSTLPTSLTIIGAGPGGYVAAFRAADLGLKVTLIDESPSLGGVCLNRGCIPSKALLHAAHLMTNSTEAKAIGLDFAAPHIDLEKLRGWKNDIIKKLSGGVAQLAKARKITCLHGKARLLNNTTLQVTKPDGAVESLSFEQALIATGSRPVELPFLPKSSRIWDSTDALDLSHVPPTLLIIGGGYIGLELGTVYAALGSKVSVVEALPALMSSADKDLADIVIRRLKKTFSAIMCATRVTAAEETSDGIRVTLKDEKGAERQETYSQILVSVGRRPNTDGLGLENTAIKLDPKGLITTDEQRRTQEKNIFAIGDVTTGPMLAHKASHEAKVAADAAAGYAASYTPKCIACVVFTDPELAWCGLTEQEARSQGINIVVSKFPWAASGRAITLNRIDGATKIIADPKSGRILGVGIAGIHAGEMIAQAALAIETGMKVDDMEQTIFAHPTLSETMLEATEGIFGQATHIYLPKK